jgi:hypothetical protein
MIEKLETKASTKVEPKKFSKVFDNVLLTVAVVQTIYLIYLLAT